MSSSRNVIERYGLTVSTVEDSDLLLSPNVFCGHEDLDLFFREERSEFEKGLFLKTYKMTESSRPDRILALASLCNHSIEFEYSQSRDQIPLAIKGLRTYPAVKIERFGVLEGIQNNGYGRFFINMLKEFFVSENRTGCRFMTVDSLVEAIPFYEKVGFTTVEDPERGPLKEKNPEEDTIPMFFNLLSET